MQHPYSTNPTTQSAIGLYKSLPCSTCPSTLSPSHAELPDTCLQHMVVDKKKSFGENMLAFFGSVKENIGESAVAILGTGIWINYYIGAVVE